MAGTTYQTGTSHERLSRFAAPAWRPKTAQSEPVGVNPGQERAFLTWPYVNKNPCGKQASIPC